MTDLNEAKTKAAAAYNAASDLFDHPANTFWDRFGRNTINRLDLKPGALVLDACCGSGASALPAAQQVGHAGHVIGIDVAEKLLNLASTKAKSKGLNNVEFRVGDMLDTGFADASFDAVVCVFGIFFVPDIPAAVSWSSGASCVQAENSSSRPGDRISSSPPIRYSGTPFAMSDPNYTKDSTHGTNIRTVDSQ